MGETHYWLISACLVTSSVIAFGANLFLLLIFCRRRGLRTVPNRFVINLLVINLLSSLLLTPLLLIEQTSLDEFELTSTETLKLSKVIIEEEQHNTTSKIEIIETSVSEQRSSLISSTSVTFLNGNNVSTNPQILCIINQSVTSLISTLSILSILLISINQYFGVLHSLRYHFYINKWRSSCAIGFTWLVAVLCSVFSTLTNTDGCLFRKCHNHSLSIAILPPMANTIYAMTYFLFIILAPFVAISIIYACIYTAAHKNSERMRKSTSATLIKDDLQQVVPIPKVQSAPNFAYLINEDHRTRVVRTCSDRLPNTNFITSLKHKISNASVVFRYREETRAAKISFIVIVLVLICYIPYGLDLLIGSSALSITVPQLFHSFTFLLLTASNAVTPFLFAYRNQRVKREIGKVLGVQSDLPVTATITRRRSTNDVIVNKQPMVENGDEDGEDEEEEEEEVQKIQKTPEVIVTCVANERKSILKRVSSNWGRGYKKCNFITVPESCCMGEARGSFSSASTQISNED